MFCKKHKYFFQKKKFFFQLSFATNEQPYSALLRFPINKTNDVASGNKFEKYIK